MLLFTSAAWGQDYSGLYFIGSRDYAPNKKTENFYLCATENWYYYQSESPYYTNTADPNNVMPFMTTYQCRNGNNGYTASNAVWIIEKKSGTNYYYIKHANSGKYLTYNVAMGNNSNVGRMRVHLEASPDDDDALFLIQWVTSTSSYNIITKNSGPDDNRKYLNITGASGGKTGNQASLQATNARSDGPSNLNVGGIVGLWTAGSASDHNSKWYLEPAVTIAPPTITNNYTADNTFTITAEEDATIYYTTDGSIPTTSTTTKGTTSVNITQTEDIKVIKAIAQGKDDDYPTSVTTYYLPACERPNIKVSGGTVTITCTTTDAAIHYTIDGAPATSSSTLYVGPFSKGDATTIRAVATKVGYAISSEALYLPPTEVSSVDEMTDMNGNYILSSSFTSW